jgi:peptidyl-prolyl cis-trans isomerase SurA
MGLPVLLVLLSILGVITALSVAEAQATAPSNSAPVLPAALTKQVALVNQHPILEGEIEQQTSYTEKLLKEHYSGNDLNQKIAEARQKALQTLIDRELIIDDFRLQGRVVPESYINDRSDDIVKHEFGGDRDAFLKTLAERHTTLEKYREEIEDTAIVGYMRSTQVTEKVDKYYQDHLDLFPQDEQINVTSITIDSFADTPASEHQNPNYLLARQVFDQAKKGVDFSALLKMWQGKVREKTMWVTEDQPRLPATSPVTWQQTIWPVIEKLQPSQTSDLIEASDTYIIARVNERRPARIAATSETADQKQAVLSTEEKRLATAWLDGLRAKAQIQIFAQQ